MKIFFLVPGKELVDGSLFLCDDAGCMKTSEYITAGGVAEVYVEYFGEEDDESASDSGSDSENEMGNEVAGESDGEPDAIINAKEDVQFVCVNPSWLTGTENLLVPNGSGVITQVISNPIKQNFIRKQRPNIEVQGQSSQLHVPEDYITSTS